jgi:hypothetical protein
MLVLTMMLASMPVMAQEPEQEAQNVEEQVAEDSGVEAAAATTDYGVGNTDVSVSYGWRSPYPYANAAVSAVGTSLAGYNIVASLPTAPARLKSSWSAYVPILSSGQRLTGDWNVYFKCDSSYMHSRSGSYDSKNLNGQSSGNVNQAGMGYNTPSTGSHSLYAYSHIGAWAWQYDSVQKVWQQGNFRTADGVDSGSVLVL